MRAVAILGVITALALVAYLVTTRERAVDPRLQERYAGRLGRLETLDHELSEDIVRARAGIVANYDPLVAVLRELRVVHEQLAEPPRFLEDEDRAALTRSVTRSLATLSREAELIESFKSENAILLNSLRFLPVAGASLAAHVQSVGEVARIDALVRDVLMLHLWNEPSLHARVGAALASLSADPSLSADEVDLVRRHSNVVTSRRPRVERLLSELDALRAARRSERLGDHYRAALAVAVRAADRRGSVVFVLALAVVVLGAAMIVLRMRKSARAIQNTSEQLAAAVDMKNRFVSMSSHEFRTPLSVILSSTELLEAYGERWTPEKKQVHIDRIRSSVQNMTQLIDGILLIGRGEAGALEFKPAPMDLDRVCLDVIGTVELKTGGDRKIEFVAYEGEPVVADERLIRHVLDNLLSNAIKYSPDGGLVRLSAARERSAVRLVIRDEGIGIPEPDRERLFGSFRRGSNVGAIPGTGLGLAVVKRAIDLHGGSVSVESAVGAGSRFEVVFPVDEVLQKESAA